MNDLTLDQLLFGEIVLKGRLRKHIKCFYEIFNFDDLVLYSTSKDLKYIVGDRRSDLATQSLSHYLPIWFKI